METHGTGTGLGDPIEVRGLELAYGDPALRDAELDGSASRIGIGSIKPNVGHLEAGAGVISLIKVLLQLQHGMLLPSVTSSEPNPQIPFNQSSFDIQRSLAPWRRPVMERHGRAVTLPRRAGVSSFGVGGANAHIIVEEAPVDAVPVDGAAASLRPHVLAVSARTEDALAQRLQDLQRFVGASDDTALPDICHSAGVGRRVFAHRAAIVGADMAQMQQRLASAATRHADTRRRARRCEVQVEVLPLGFLFTGQGSQYAGMGRTLYDTYPVFKKAHRRVRSSVGLAARPAADVGDLRCRRLGRSGCSSTRPGSLSRRCSHSSTQLSMLWRSWGVEPSFVLGHSVGEIGAMCVAGGLSLDDALRLIAARGGLMQALPSGGAMTSVMADEARVRVAIAGRERAVSIAAVNGPLQTVISGDADAVREVTSALAAKGVKAKALVVSHAFHSPLMEPMLAEYERVVRSITFRKPAVPFVSCVTGERADDEVTRPEYWMRNVTDAVRFVDGMRALRVQGAAGYVEVGPHPVLLGMARQVLTEIEGEPWLPSSRKDADGPATIADSLAQLFVAGGSVDWKAAEPGRRITLPAYPFARKRYWMVHSPVERHLAGTVRGESKSAAAPLAMYATSWRRRPAPAIATMERGRWLVVAEESGIAAPLAEALEHAGARCLVATHGGVPAGAASNRRALDLDAADAFDVLFSGADPTAGVVYVAGKEDADAARHASIGIHRIAGLSRAMARGGQAAGRLWIVTAGAVRVDAAGDADVVPSQTAWWGLGRAIALEQPSNWGGLVDTGLPAADPSQVSDAILAGGDEDQVAIRHGERWVARLVTHTPAATRPISLDARGVYLVTGGLGALGARTARWLVDRGARRLVLVGRSGTSHPSGAAAVASLQAAGADVQVVVADVADPADVARLFADIDRGNAPLKGVVHAAGVDRPEPLDRLTTEAANAVLAPKVAGTWLLHSHTQHRSLDLFLCFSSISAVLGAAGRAAYTAANAFQDGLVEHRRHLGLAGNSVEWGPWRGGGIATPASLQEFERIGNFGLDPDEAVAALDLLVADSTPVTAVAAIDWDRFRTAYEARRARPLIGEISAGSSAAPHPEQTSGAPWCEELADVAVADREGWLTMRLRAEAAAILGFADPGELSLDPERLRQRHGLADGGGLRPSRAARHRGRDRKPRLRLCAPAGARPSPAPGHRRGRPECPRRRPAGGNGARRSGCPGSTASRSALVELSPAERRGADRRRDTRGGGRHSRLREPRPGLGRLDVQRNGHRLADGGGTGITAAGALRTSAKAACR